MVTKEQKQSDRYEIIIDGQWYRYTDDRNKAVKYACLMGGAVVLDMDTGKIVANYR